MKIAIAKPDFHAAGGFENVVEQFQIFDRTRHRADRVEAFRGEFHSGATVSAERGLESEHAAEGSRTQHGTARLRPECRRNHEVGDCGRRSAGRAARRVVEIERISRGSRCHARELARRRLAEYHRSRLPQ